MHEQLRLRAIEVELDLCPDELIVLGNAIQLEQVFINLLTNARDALAEVPRKTVRIASSRERDTITITFSDSGPGIAPGLEQRIFDPFFTTKEVGAGTGLGLSITYGIVRDHGGNIYVAGDRGKGACFVVELPVAPPDAEEQAVL
jgi:C4-dicarboxylate-specific signal transduction histidine kinase